MILTMRILGLTAAAVFVAVGLAVAAALLPLLIGLGVIVAFGALCVRQEQAETARKWLDSDPVRVAVAVMGGVVIVSFAAIGMATVVGGAATALAGAIAVALLVYRRLRRDHAGDTECVAGPPPDSARARSPDVDAPPAAAQPLMPDDPSTLATDQLCRAWRVSYLLLPNARVPAELEHASLLRRRYLDELARRDPEGFRRWLDDGARAVSDPSRYICGRSGPPERDNDQAA